MTRDGVRRRPLLRHEARRSPPPRTGSTPSASRARSRSSPAALAPSRRSAPAPRAIVARKIAATLTSTGTPALFVHPTDALHGGLGVIGRQEVVIAVSNSGETEEILALLPVPAQPRGAR